MTKALPVLLLVAMTLAMSACQSKSAGDGDREPGVEVPNLIGMEYRPTQKLLAKLGLRWRFMGTERIWSKPPPENMWSTADDDLVTEQSPAPGTKVAPNTVLELRTSCTMKPPPPGMACID